MSGNPLVRLSELGQSPWLDYITRDLLHSGELAALIERDGLRGMTTNPSIFEKAIATSTMYDADITSLAAGGQGPLEVYEQLAVADVQEACDLFLPVYERTDGGDGFVSLEVSPRLADDPTGTVGEAVRLWRRIERPNLMVKIPGTLAGLIAVRRCLSLGINVNVTLLFSTDRYDAVLEAYLDAIEERLERGESLRHLASVASFFISRIDGRIDPCIDALEAGARRLRGSIALANAGRAYASLERTLGSPRWASLARHGARPQRLLWASTSTKDPAFSDLHYVEPLIGLYTVTTLPPETLAAYRDHGDPQLRILETVAGAEARLEALAPLGIDLDAALAALEADGVAKFGASFTTLLDVIAAKSAALTHT